jgi:DNA recombination protein RmuC
MNKLTEGSGNLVGRIERLKILGAKTNKSLNEKLVHRAIESDPDVLDASDEDPLLN